MHGTDVRCVVRFSREFRYLRQQSESPGTDSCQPESWFPDAVTGIRVFSCKCKWSVHFLGWGVFPAG